MQPYATKWDWNHARAMAGGETALFESYKPNSNNYVIANPARGDLFVGRKDIMKRLEELWRGNGLRPSVVIYGHRRMGKPSILHNLGARLGEAARIIHFNMQLYGHVDSKPCRVGCAHH